MSERRSHSETRRSPPPIPNGAAAPHPTTPGVEWLCAE